MAAKRFFNNINKPFILVKWKIEANYSIFSGTTVLTYIYQKDSDETKSNLEPQKLKSSVQGVVLSLLVKEGDVVQPGAPLLEFDSCSHEIVLKGICANCGKDIWRSSEVLYNFGDVGLTVTQRQATLLMESGEESLLRRRKLSLLICVDQILIDISSTAKPISQSQKTSTVKSLSSSIKLLPGALEFLKSISLLYDVYFFTYGGLLEGLEIHQLLNKKWQTFPRRVWTKDDLLGTKSHEKKLEVVFPNGDSMVCVVDWHEDTWKSDQNVVLVKPYSTFIASEGNAHDHVLSNLQTKSTIDNDPASVVVSSTISEQKITEDDDSKGRKLNLQETCDVKVNGPFDSFIAVQSNRYYYENSSDYMLYLKTILKNIHSGYYKLLDQMIIEQMYIIHQQVIPHLKFVIPYVWKSILSGVNIVFSGLIPMNAEAQCCPFWTLAESLGANVSSDLVLHDKETGTTHIIAAKSGTNKVNTAKRFKSIYVVRIEWLYDCAFRWNRVNEKYFLLKDDTISAEESSAKPNDDEILLDKQKVVSNWEFADTKDEAISTKKANENLKNDISLDSKQEIISSHKHEDSPKRCKYADDEDSSFTTPIPNVSPRLSLDLSPEELENMRKQVDCEIDEDDSDDEKQTSRNRLETVKRKIRNKWGFYPIPHSQWKQKRYYTLSRYSSYLEQLSDNSLPEWELVCDNDSNNVSETESPTFDYGSSDDEDM